MRRRPQRSVLVLAGATLVLASLACASGPPNVVAESVHSLRDRDGVCAGRTFVATPPHGATLLGCLRTGAPGTRFDNGEARLITLLRANDDDDADLADWQVLVLRDGEQVLRRALDGGPSHRRCRAFGLRCTERVADVAPIPAGLGSGTYTLRYRLMSEEAYAAGVEPVELTIVLR